MSSTPLPQTFVFFLINSRSVLVCLSDLN
uniref:Uncharacterized protein n=1 Tax=Rhizophora mucronata TaxID=61149 RepID=A0A2P2N496_RHIMU